MRIPKFPLFLVLLSVFLYFLRKFLLTKLKKFLSIHFQDLQLSGGSSYLSIQNCEGKSPEISFSLSDLSIRINSLSFLKLRDVPFFQITVRSFSVQFATLPKRPSPIIFSIERWIFGKLATFLIALVVRSASI
jgi:hypothetical protein